MAFRVWSCEEFENGSFMRADYSIKCSMDNPEYASIVALALLGILLFPVGISLLYIVLFYQARQSILASKPTALSKVNSPRVSPGLRSPPQDCQPIYTKPHVSL